MYTGVADIFFEETYQVAQMLKNLPSMQETWVQSLGREDYPLEEGMATHSNILARRIPMDRGAWQVTVHGVKESDTNERLSLLFFHTKATVHSKQLLHRVKLGQRAGSDMKNAY